jgi:uncharacterized protein (DUF433 family)
VSVPKAEPEIAEQNPVEVPLYTPWDTAHYLHVPLWALFTLTGRFRGWPEPEWFFWYFGRGFPGALLIDEDVPFPVIPEGRSRISFQRFAGLFVRAATLQLLVEASPGGGRQLDRWENLFHAVWRGLKDTEQEPVPFDGAPIEERVDALVRPYAQRLDDEHLALLRKWFALRLERIDATDGVPARLYPFSRDPAEKSPRVIVIDPRLRFGRPTVAGRGIPTDILFERHQAGDSVAELAGDYGLATEEVEEAIRYEGLPFTPQFPFFGW